MAANSSPPKVFISYAWEEDIKTWVLDFATRLRSDGVDTILDQWEVVLGDQLTEFMEKSVRESDFVLIVCTPTYKRKSDRRRGGVGYEGSIITGEVFAKNNHRKFIPVLRKGKWLSAAPTWATSKLFVDLRNDPYNEMDYQQLLDTLFRKSPAAPPMRDDTLRETAKREAKGKAASQKEQQEAAEKAVRDKAEQQAAQSHRNTVEVQQSPDNERTEYTLKTLESQAVHYETVGDLWNARKTWYEIRRIDPLYPRVDLKIRDLEQGLRPEPESAELDATQSRKPSHRRLSTLGIVALIGLVGTILVGLLSFPLWEQWFSPAPTAPHIEMTSTQSTATNTPQGGPSIQASVTEKFPAPGSKAEGITWDGTNLWITDNSGTIFKADASGKLLGSFSSPEVTPQGLTWDGASFWVFTTNSSFIYQFQVSGENAQTLSSFRSPAEVIGGDITQDMAWDGESLWYANRFKVYNLDTSGTVLQSLTFPLNVTGLDWDGENLWIAYNDFPDNAILSKVNTEGEILDTYPSPIFQINALAWADEYLWALGLDVLGGDIMIYKLGISN